MSTNNVGEYIRGMNDLSTVPALLAKILSVVRNEMSSPKDLFKLVSHDLSLAEKVVRVANSAVFGHSGQINNIDQAIMFLGYDRIKSIAVGMTVMDFFPVKSSFNIKNLWLHGYEVALIAQTLSELICMTCPRECFLSGLLHDIGRIIFFRMDNEKYLEVKTTKDMLERETEVFGLTHAEAGALFTSHHGMPQEIISSIKYHHTPSQATEYKDAVSIVALAEALSRRLSPMSENDGIWTEEHDALMMEFQLKDDDLLFIGDRFCAARVDIHDFFNS
jgi:putative nucleotidyltransferase with HDIG domain